MRTLTRLVAAAAALGAGVAACGGGGGDVRYLSIATGGTGGVYYPYGGGIAKVLTERLPGVRATAEATGASVDNLKFLREGRADLAFTLADTLAEAAAGRGAFDGRAVPVATLAVLYSNYTHLVTLAGSGIEAVQDLRGRTISTGSPGSGTDVTARRLLATAGLDPARDVRLQGLGVSESAGALKDGKIAAFFWSGGLPTAAVQDLAHAPGVTLRLLPTAHLLPALQRAHGDLYFALEIPAAAYAGVPAPVPVVGVSNLLVASRALPDDLVYDITRLLFEHRAELAAIHPEARKLSPAAAAGESPAPFHPGAMRWSREQGVWNR